MALLQDLGAATFVPLLLLAACGGSQNAPAPDSAAPSGRPELTAETCEASGGMVIGDIGDGAIHSPDYRCTSGAEPMGTIAPPPGGPVAVEGSVCCPK